MNHESDNILWHPSFFFSFSFSPPSHRTNGYHVKRTVVIQTTVIIHHQNANKQHTIAIKSLNRPIENGSLSHPMLVIC